MELKDQVCSLKLAKKLKKLGVKQESLFWWEKSIKRAFKGKKPKTYSVLKSKKDRTFFANYQHYSAFTVAELGEKLPGYIDLPASIESDYLCITNKTVDYWLIEYQELGIPKANPLKPYVKAKTEANARAKMLIYLIENKLIKL